MALFALWNKDVYNWVMAYSFSTKPGQPATAAISTKYNLTGYTLTVEVDDRSLFSSPSVVGTASFANGVVTLSFTAAQVDAIKDCFYRIKATRSSSTFYLTQGSISYVEATSATGDLLNAEGYIKEEVLPPNLGATLLSEKVGAPGGIAPLDKYSAIPASVNPESPQVGFYFNSYTVNDAVNDQMTPASANVIEDDLGVKADYILAFTGILPGGNYSLNMWNKLKPLLDTGRQVVYNLELQGSLAQINSGSFNTAISQFGQYIRDYATANPNWKGKIFVKLLHEMNASINYPWCVYTATNVADNGGSVDNAIASFITAFRKVSTDVRTACTLNGEVKALIISEFHQANDAGINVNNSFRPLDQYYAGDDYIDIVGVTVYNRYGLTSGNNLWTSFEHQVTPALEAFRRVAPTKPVMIGETSSMAGGQITNVSVTAGGSNYAAGTTLTVGGPGGGATVTPTISGGVITAVTVNSRGWDYNDSTYIQVSNQGSGTGATFGFTILGEKYSKADWFFDAMSFIKNQSDIRYVTFFFTNIGTGADVRMWALNTPREKQRWREGYKVLKGRVQSNHLAKRGRIGNNIFPDPYGNDVSRWTAAGSNVGTLSRTTAPQNHAGLDQGPSDTTGVIRLTHNGTFNLDPLTNYMYVTIPQNLLTANLNMMLSFDARFKTSGTKASVEGGKPWLVSGLMTNDANAFLRKLQPGKLLSHEWRRYNVSTYMTAGSAGARVVFAIGNATQSGTLMLSNIKLEYGDHATDLMPVQHQLSRTSVQDANYAAANFTTDALLAYTTLTAARTVTLPDGTTLPVGTTRIIKDEAGTAGTSNLTIATSASQTIDGSATKVINTNYGLVRVYWSGAQWFTW